MTPRPLILKRFLKPKSIQDQTKRALEIVTKIKSNFIEILIDFGSILDPTGSPKIEHFYLIFTLGATLGPSWRQEAPKVLQDGSRARFSKKFAF